MKKEFKSSFITENLENYFKDSITWENILNNNNLTLYDKLEFLFKYCELTTLEEKRIVTYLACHMVNIYEIDFPNDVEIRNCLKKLISLINNNVEHRKKELVNLKKIVYNKATEIYSKGSIYTYKSLMGFWNIINFISLEDSNNEIFGKNYLQLENICFSIDSYYGNDLCINEEVIDYLKNYEKY